MLKYLLPILWAGVIFALSCVPGSDYPQQAFDYSWIAHFVEFFVLTILVLRAVKLKDRNILLFLFIISLFALSDELHQAFVPFRNTDIMDWLVDFWAIITAMLCWLVWNNKKSKMAKK